MAICYFYIELFYNEEDVVETSKLIIPINNPKRLAGYYIHGMNYENARLNYRALENFNNYTDAIKSNLFIDLYESYKENKDDF